MGGADACHMAGRVLLSGGAEMSVDKLVDSSQLDTDLTSVANAIRTKGGTSAQLAFPAGFVSAIENIPSGGVSGLTLLGSGTYTKTSDTANISIPVTYTGTPKLFYAVNTTPKAATEQSVLFGRWISFEESDAQSVLPVGGLWMAKGLNSSGSGRVTVASGVIPQLTATTMSSTRPGSGWTHCAGTWKWYIYGEASS